MSYILEAMRKSERDATIGQAVNLPTASPAWYSKLLYPSLVSGLIILVGAAIWAGTDWTGTLTSQIKNSPAPTTTDQSAEAPTPAQHTAIQAAPTQSIEVITSPAAVVEQPPTTPSLETTRPNRQVKIPTPTRWQELPTSAQLVDKLPEKLLQMRIGIHVFDNTPEKRFLLIDGRRYQEGDTLFGDARISEITPNGIAIRYRNLHFHTDR